MSAGDAASRPGRHPRRRRGALRPRLDGDDALQAHPGGARSTPPARSGACSSRSPISAASRPTASAPPWSDARADGVRLDAVVRTEEPTTLALAETDETGSAQYRFYERATRLPG